MSAQHIERDIDAALTIGVDYIILDGRGVAPALHQFSFATTSPYQPFRLWLARVDISIAPVHGR
ncbi:hypothetical protein R2360_18980 [Mycobacteroides chelonae]|nr:hypothetical protein [Mycobacteroides chelonae]MEC4841485.1 hypothetical protein [Mycobacteroides chelonae]MEC4871849.1 hypothetical protein [Mycobacteroides chelonae]